MTKYAVYTDGDNRPVKKFKRENEAIDYVNDVRNLSRFGYLTLVKETDTGEAYAWDNLAGGWRVMDDQESQMEGYV